MKLSQSKAALVARSAFWPYIGQDKQTIIKLVRVTPDTGIKGDHLFNGEVVRPPITGKLTHYFLLPSLSYQRWAGIDLNNERNKHIGTWLSLKTHWDKFNISFELYTYKGISIPLSMLYYRVSNNGVMHFAIVEDFATCSIDPLVDTLYLRMYDNIYYSSGYGNISNLGYYGTKVVNMSDAAALVTIQNTLDLSKALCFRNGKLVDKQDVAKTAVGDYLEIFTDESISFTCSTLVSDLPYYHSTKDKCNKYVFVLNNNGLVNTQQRYWVDDVSFYLYNPTLKVGIYLHTNEKKNIINLTHNIFAIASDYLNDVAEKNGEVFDLSVCAIMAVCREDNAQSKTFDTTLCLNDLYYSGFQNGTFSAKAVANLICSPTTLNEWRGDNLENGVMAQFTKSNYGNSDTLCSSFVGYHSLFNVYGNCFQKVNDQDQVPELFAEDFTLQTFDANGFSTNVNSAKSLKIRPFSVANGSYQPTKLAASDFGGTMPSAVLYYPWMQQAVLNNPIVNNDTLNGLDAQGYPVLANDTGVYDSHRTLATVTLNKFREYRIYYKAVASKYYIPAIVGTHYTISGNTLTWLTASASINTCIRSSEDGYCIHGTINLSNSGSYKKRNKKVYLRYTPSVLNGHMGVGSISLGGGYVARHEDATWGYIHVYVNGRRLIENVDYVIDRTAGQILLYSEVVLLNDTADQSIIYSIYCFGHPTAAMERNKALEFGVVYKSLISNDAKYESYKNRNANLIVDGATVAMDEGFYKLADESNNSAALSSINGSFYLIEDCYYDVGHMYQTHSDFNTQVQMDAERAFREKTATAINAVKVSAPVSSSDIGIVRNVLVSAFLNAVILDVVYGIYTYDTTKAIDVNYHMGQLTTMYNDIYKVDPVYRYKTDLLQFTQNIDLHPTYCNYVMSVSADKYKFIREIVNAFAPSIDINRFFNIG